MKNPPKIYLYTLRTLVTGTVIVFSSIFLFVLISSSVEAKSAENKNNSIKKYSSSPNLVTVGFSRVIGGLGQMADFAQGQIIHSTSETGSVLASASKTVASTTGSGISYTGKAAASVAVNVGEVARDGVVLAISAPVSAIDAVSNSSAVRSVTVPDSNFEVPIIDPNSAELKAAIAALPPGENAEDKPLDNDTPKWPISGQVTTYFGVPHWPYQATHSGIDISDGQSAGITTIRPFRTGKVIEIVYSEYGLGNHVIVDHGNSVTSVYAHLATISASVGQEVSHSSVLGTEGTSGLSTGPHLHFEIRVNGLATDPTQFIAALP